MTDLEQRLRWLEDERAIIRRLYRYGHCIDYGLEEEWAECFTSDGVFEVKRTHPPGHVYQGRQQLLEFARSHTRAPANFHKHVVVDPMIEVNGDRATAVSYFVRLDVIDATPVVRTFGRYRDTFRRTGAGWRIEHRTVEVEGRIGR
ncbi:nuclear transport factor 2 family protein [Microbacterium sp. NIBRBAC000506063]|uniref:nuclear transport factor 2 family protein n=1 Tax=Microbacterium sp. NIBRBAC000506063 TaxID=2734618 RepID=UPI001BB622BD|nr:nuclear transport factor 2 family protein [Microbacterium sp. NIBRBAC000506063]QTV80481.1 nuclear transport factor 2 family protein [Microbacterium sp. NIBRBAC000506063]